MVWRFLKKLKIELPYDVAIPLLDRCPDKTIIQRDTCTPMFIAVLFTRAKTWKQSKCLLTDERIKKMRYIYTVEYYSATKKNEIMPFAETWMDLEIIVLNEVSQTETNITDHLHVESKKKIRTNLFTKQKQTHRHRKQTYGYQRGRGEG